MNSSAFRFKQFAVEHNQCAMKVNTDGVLLGAWADVSNSTRILDVGTGSGVIALMAVQRNSKAQVDAIEIHAPSFEQARKNFENSKWSNQLTVFHQSLQKYSAEYPYDTIISNPPYFVNDLKGSIVSKNRAKHTLTLTYGELITHSIRLLTSAGKLFFAIPSFNTAMLAALAREKNFYITRQADVIAVEGKQAYLSLLQLESAPKMFDAEHITIQSKNGQLTKPYKVLTGDFYL